LATFLTNHGRIDEAEPLARRALKLADKESESGKVSISEICRTLVLLSGIHSVQRRGAEADRLARRSLAMAERAWGESDSKVVEPLLAVAVAVSGLGHLDEAEVLLKRSLRICEKDPGCIEKLQDVYVMLELVLRVQGKIAESQEMKAKMVSIASMRH
jgi:hypothetical protein